MKPYCRRSGFRSSFDAAEEIVRCISFGTAASLSYRPGDLVAVQGIGGLGHLGIQFPNKFGHRAAAVGRDPENAALAEKLGAHH